MPPKKQKKQNHAMAPELPIGLILQDCLKKQWKVGVTIGKGGFGSIYSCLSVDKKDKTQCVLKVEPKDNGPLFVEINFYQRAAKAEMIEKWAKSRNLNHLGVPKLFGTGNHDLRGCSLRFLIMQRFGCDLQKLFERHKVFPAATCFRIGLSLTDALEYLHEHEYVHADIKGANVMLDEHERNVYLVDYGLAHRYNPAGVHQPYKEDPRTRHDGTIEYTSTDAHKGVRPSRRSDFEILAFVLVHWSTGSLPWMSMLTNPINVQFAKEKFLSSVQKNSDVSPELKQLLCSVKELAYQGKPDYPLIKKYFANGLKRLKANNSGKLLFNHSPGSGSVSSSTASREPQVDVCIDSPDDSAGPTARSKVAKTVPKQTNIAADAKVTQRVANLGPQRFTPAAVDSLTNNIASSDELKTMVFNNLDRQVQTSPWLYEKYREERRKRRREAATGQ